MKSLHKVRANRQTQADTPISPTIRPHARHWAYFLLASLALQGATSWAQTNPASEGSATSSGGYVGLGVLAAPRYQGSDESKTTGIPGFEYHWANGLFVGGADGLVGVQINSTPQLQLGLALGLDEGREASDSRYLSGMGDIAARGTLNLYAKTAINDQFSLSTSLQIGTGKSREGGLLNVGANYGVSLTPDTRMTFNVGATFANADYMQDYFGVTAAQASASGYKRYTPASGLRDVTVGLSLQHQISREWMLITNLKSTTLANAAKDSPLVRKATSQSAYAAIAYSF